MQRWKKKKSRDTQSNQGVRGGFSQEVIFNLDFGC